MWYLIVSIPDLCILTLIARCHITNDGFDEILSHSLANVYINTDSVSDTVAVTYSILTSECKQPQVLFDKHKTDFPGNNKDIKRR